MQAYMAKIMTIKVS